MWNIVITDKAKKQLSKLDHSARKRILDFLYQDNICKAPKSSGKILKGSWKGLWRYRVGDYRIICELKNKQLMVIVVDVKHRK